MALVIGNVYDGKIVNVANFGVFVDIDGTTGLVHISEVSNKYVKNIKEYLNDVKEVKVKVLSIDGNGKISLSIKQADEANSINKVNYKKEYRDRDNNKFQKNPKMKFEDILSKYLKDSEERMQDFRRSQDSKQRGYSRRNFG